MLLGTELEEAYDISPMQLNSRVAEVGPSQSIPSQPIPRPAVQQHHQMPATQQQPIPQNNVARAPQPPQAPPPSGPMYNANQYNQQYNYEQAAIRQAYLDQQYRLAQVQSMASGNRQSNNASSQRASDNNELGYFDMLGSKKRDMLKLVIMAMMILLALSLHSLVSFWMKEYLDSNDFSFRQEVGIRLLYPVVVLFILWNLKAAKV
jgi:hypothetical protein